MISSLLPTTKSRRFALFVLVGLFLASAGLAGCTTHKPQAVGAAPTFPAKSIPDKSITFDEFDRKRAIRAFSKVRAHMLFEVVINRDGNVVQVRTIRSLMDDISTAQFKASIWAMKFTSAASRDPYPFRALFVPVGTSTEIRDEPSGNRPLPSLPFQ